MGFHKFLLIYTPFFIHINRNNLNSYEMIFRGICFLSASNNLHQQGKISRKNRNWIAKSLKRAQFRENVNESPGNSRQENACKRAIRRRRKLGISYGLTEAFYVRRRWLRARSSPLYLAARSASRNRDAPPSPVFAARPTREQRWHNFTRTQERIYTWLLRACRVFPEPEKLRQKYRIDTHLYTLPK